MSETKKRQWSGTTSGSGWMHRYLIKMLKVMPLRGMYWFASVFVLPVILVVNRKPVRMISHYFRSRHGLSGLALKRAVWLNHYRMMQVVIDRFAAYAGKEFTFELEGNEFFRELENEPEGFILLSSHVGNSELVGYSIGSSKKRLSALVYAGEAPEVMENRRRLLAEHNIEMIPVTDSLDHLYAMNEALGRGNILGMPADRVIGSQKTFTATILGKDAEFPLGPFATAVQRGVNAVSIFMVKESVARYRLIVKPVHVDPVTKPGRREKMIALGQEFVKGLDDVVRRYPHQWYNYFDFWNDFGK